MSPSVPMSHGPRAVRSGAAVMIAAHLGFMAWALYPSWFYLDDFFLLGDAPTRLGIDHVMEPHDSQFMPVGRTVSWIVAASEAMQWPVAASLTLVLQVLASIACLWALTTLFGHRTSVLVLLGVYLSSAMTMSATMWWAASLNALPLQIAFFCSIGCWFQHQRTRRRRWLGLTLLAVALGLASYVKALFLLPLLGALTIAYFAEGSLLARVRTVMRRDSEAVVAAVAMGGAYLTYYLTSTPQLTSSAPESVAATLAQRMLGESLAVGLLGGPWRWDDENPPTAVADAPAWTIPLAWVILVGAAAYFALRRERTGRAWLIFSAYAVGSYLMVLFTRAPLVGSIAGLEYRYLSDVAAAWPITLGLVALPLTGTTEGSARRQDPLLRVGTPRIVSTVGLTTLVGSGLVSSALYVSPWHSDNDADQYFDNATDSIEATGPVDLADQVVPDRVIPGYQYPRNRLVALLPLFVDHARFPTVSSNLAVIDDSGTPRRALIDIAVSTPQGADGDCGTRIDDSGGALRLEAPTIDYPWWVRIPYLGFAEDEVQVTVAGEDYDVTVRRGLHSLFLHVDGIISTIRFTGVEPGNALCVDQIEIGEPVPGGPL